MIDTPASPPTEKFSEPPTSQNMIVWGWVVTFGGLGLMVWAFLMNVSVVGGAYGGDYGLPSRVINIGLLSTREMTLAAGCAFVVAGIVLVAAGHVRKGLELLAAK